MENKKQTIIIVALVMIVLILIGYIVTQNIDFCKTEQIRNESFLLGFNQGAEYWNSVVVDTWNNNMSLIWAYNQTFFKLSKDQICGKQNG